MTAVEYISDTTEIIKASHSKFQPDVVVAFEFSERSLLTPALPAKHHSAERTQVFDVRQIKRIDHHPAESDQGSTAVNICNTENWLNWNGDLEVPTDSKDNCKADDESNIEYGNGTMAWESPEHQVVCVAPNVAGLIRPTWRSNKQATEGLMTVSSTETRRNKANRTE